MGGGSGGEDRRREGGERWKEGREGKMGGGRSRVSRRQPRGRGEGKGKWEEGGALTLSIYLLQDYGLEREKFRELPQVKSSGCPEEFMELTFHCCRVGATVDMSVITSVVLLKHFYY